MKIMTNATNHLLIPSHPNLSFITQYINNATVSIKAIPRPKNGNARIPCTTESKLGIANDRVANISEKPRIIARNQ